MITDLDIYRSAGVIIMQYGEDAPIPGCGAGKVAPR
jgi:hypothetical protein